MEKDPNIRPAVAEPPHQPAAIPVIAQERSGQK